MQHESSQLNLRQIPLFVNGFQSRDCHALLVLYAGTANYLDDSTHTISEELLLQVRRMLEFLYALWADHDGSMHALYEEWGRRIVQVTEYRRLALIKDQSRELDSLCTWIGNMGAKTVSSRMWL